jgi:excisionase family DNA binding protein
VIDDAIERAAEAKKGSPFLTAEQAAFYIGLTSQTLLKMRRDGRGPRYRKHGRFIRYHIADLDAWSETTGIGCKQPAEPGKEKDDPDGEPQK